MSGAAIQNRDEAYLSNSEFSICKKTMPNSVDSRCELKMVLLEQVGFQKRFLKYLQHSVYHATIQESAVGIPLGLGMLMG